MGTNTTNLNLYKPDVAEEGWGLTVNVNWDTLDNAAIANATSTISGAWTFSNTVELTKQLLPTATELTIASGVIAVTQTYHTVDTQNDDATDNLDTINGNASTERVIIKPADDARTVVVKHNTGNIWLKGKADLTLDDVNDSVELYYNGSKWTDMGAGGGGGGGDLLSTNNLSDVASASTSATNLGLGTGDTPEFDGLTIGSANGIDVNPGSDTDADLLTVGVTGTPILSWDESEDRFNFSKAVNITEPLTVRLSSGFDTGTFKGADGTATFFRFVSYRTSASTHGLLLGDGARGTEGTPAVLSDGDEVFRISARTWDTTNFDSTLADMRFINVGTPSLNSVSGRIEWRTTSTGVSATERMRLDEVGNLGLNATSFGTSAVGVFAIGNGTPPADSPANMTQLYSEDVSSSSELKVRDEAGNITTLSPHSADELNKLPVDASHIVPYIYKSENPYLGKKIVVDMEKVIRVLETLSGESLMTVTNIPTENWDANQESIRVATENERTTIQNQMDELDAEIATETDIKIKAQLQSERAGITKPDVYTKKSPPVWLKNRGVASNL